MIEQLEHRLGNEVLISPAALMLSMSISVSHFTSLDPSFLLLAACLPWLFWGLDGINVNKSCPIDCQVLEPMRADNNIVLIISKSQRQVPSQHLL